jgi:hypothetical protein
MARTRCAIVAGLGLICALFLASTASAAGIDISVTEGQAFSKIVANEGVCFQTGATINWGDGTATSTGTAAANKDVTGAHTYAAPGVYTGTVSYPCAQLGAPQADTFHATVLDAPLTPAGRNVSGSAGVPLSAVVAHFSDANPGAVAADFSAKITWGDGATTAGTIAVAPAGGFDVTGTHTYTTAGQFPLTVSILDFGGSSAATSSVASIAPGAAPAPAPAATTGPPSAQLLVAPNPSCTDVEMTLDARASTAPAGIVSYHFWYTEPSGKLTFDLPPPVEIASGPSPLATTEFTWNRGSDSPFSALAGGSYFGARDPAQVWVTVTDGRGATSTTTETVTFLQEDNTTPRPAKCPKVRAEVTEFPFATPRTFPPFVVATTTLTTAVPCRSRAGCLGFVVVTRAASRRRVATHAAKPKAVVIAHSSFRVAESERVAIAVPLTKTGRSLLSRGKSVRAEIVLGAVTPNGKTLRRTKTVTLRRHPRA